jgi:hypothetical protein
MTWMSGMLATRLKCPTCLFIALGSLASLSACGQSPRRTRDMDVTRAGQSSDSGSSGKRGASAGKSGSAAAGSCTPSMSDNGSASSAADGCNAGAASAAGTSGNAGAASAGEGGAGGDSAGSAGDGGAAANRGADAGASASSGGAANGGAGARAGTGGAGASAGSGGAAGRAGASAGAGGAANGGAGAGVAGTSAGAGGAGNAGGAAAGSGGSDAPVDPASLTFLSDTDRGEGVVLGTDRLSAEWLGLDTFGIRSTRAVQPGSGVFYFEAAALGEFDGLQLGVATAAAPRERAPGTTPDGFGLDTGGRFIEGEDWQEFSPNSAHYGFIVDYRGTTPTVHVLSGSGLLRSRNLSGVTQPLFIQLTGMRRMPGMQVRINPGNDIINRPFEFDPRSALQDAGLSEVAGALVLGWGASHAAAWNQPPTITLNPPASTSIELGQSLTLSAAAEDAESGSLSSTIQWADLATGYGPDRQQATGESFRLMPAALGHHTVQLSVSDSGGKLVSSQVMIEVRGSLPQFQDVRLTEEPGLSGRGIVISSDGLRTRWTEPDKYGIRANQGLYGGFWYFEGHRLIQEANQAVGLVIGNVSLDAYHFDVTPPSCSVNTVGPGVYQNLIVMQTTSLPDVSYYGLAVDYRASYPTVYIIMDGKLSQTLQLRDATVPVYPMLYGNPTNAGAEWDMEINFGGSPFHEDPVAALQAAGIDTSGLQLCWGSQNRACTSPLDQ